MSNKVNNTILTAVVAAACALGMTMVRADESKTLTAVKTGAAQLQCQFASGWQVVPADKVVDYTEGEWQFSNGYASNCQVY